ncbi:MAG: hypothetical protein NTX86_03900 [Candidatus Dependentiae bacterium]|nr:hypothetical protein [Candidatus Dependentiae bacterium]
MKKFLNTVLSLVLLTSFAQSGAMGTKQELQDLLMQTRLLGLLEQKNKTHKAFSAACSSGLKFLGTGASYLGRSALHNPSKAIAAAAGIAVSGYVLHRLMKKSDTQILDLIAQEAGKIHGQVVTGQIPTQSLGERFAYELKHELQAVKSLPSAPGQVSMQKFSELETKITNVGAAVADYKANPNNSSKKWVAIASISTLCDCIATLKNELNPPSFFSRNFCKFAVATTAAVAGFAGYVVKYGLPSWFSKK